jgi:hypothetical protein
MVVLAIRATSPRSTSACLAANGISHASQEANRVHARLRGPGDRAQCPTQTITHPAQAPLLPWRAIQLTKAIHVFRTHESEDEKAQLLLGHS